MTREEWDAVWWVEFRRLRKENPASDMIGLQKYATDLITQRIGARPSENIAVSLVRSLALRWLKGKVDDLRKQGTMTTLGKVFKALEGWKLVIGVLVLFGTKVYDSTHGGSLGDVVGGVLGALGWLPGPQSGFTPEGITVAAASGVAVFGFFYKLYVAQKQLRAGSSVAGLLSTEGYVTAASHTEIAAAIVSSQAAKAQK